MRGINLYPSFPKIVVGDPHVPNSKEKVTQYFVNRY